jgi:hypothetical protein
LITALKTADSGKLRIGDNWNAIRIIALSQSNPLKAVAEFVENSIDARARHVTLVRGKEHGIHFLRIKDDGEGIRRNELGRPDFEYVATHICDSIKRRLKAEGGTGMQGEFGIGLLSFWTVGEELVLTSAGADGKTYQMQLHESASSPQKDFFEFPGPLFNVRISPASSVMRVGGTKNLRAVPRDRANRQVEKDLVFRWEIVHGDGDGLGILLQKLPQKMRITSTSVSTLPPSSLVLFTV